jgi:2,4-diaminopentanoate dehydrogenase
VIVWGPGTIGTELILAILDHRDDLELVGVKVYSPGKDGQDVGTLIGREPIGLTATTDVDALLALKADLVLYLPRVPSIDDVCAILESGANVATTAFLFHPQRTHAADRDRVLAACKAGGTSVHGSGINPGLLSGVLPLALSGMSRTIDKITFQERADWTMYPSTSITFDNCAFGQPIDSIGPKSTAYLSFMSGLFEEMVWFLADELNAGIDDVAVTVEAIPAKRDHQIFDRLLKAGTTAGQRWNWVGLRDGEPRIEMETLWTVGGEYPEHWPRPRDGWTLTIEGDPSMQLHYFGLASFSSSASIDDHVRSVNVGIGMQVLNAARAVIEAPTGFATMGSLPLIRSHTGFASRQ